MAQQGVAVGDEMKLSKGKLKPNNRSKFLKNEISPSQPTSRLESWPGTAELQGGHFSVPQFRARSFHLTIHSPTSMVGWKNQQAPCSTRGESTSLRPLYFTGDSFKSQFLPANQRAGELGIFSPAEHSAGSGCAV